MEKSYKKTLRPLLMLLGGAFLLRIILVMVTPGYPYDQSCFFAWAGHMAEVGPAGFYAPDYFADYPPGYMLVLWPIGELIRLLHLGMEDKLAVLLMALPVILCDLALAALIWRIGTEKAGEKQGLWFAAFAAFCPALLYDTAVWKQIDGVLCLCMVGCFWLLEKRRYLPAALVFGIGLAIKPQALLLGPVLAVCFLYPLFPRQGRSFESKKLVSTAALGVLGILLALLPVVLCTLPFTGFAGAPEFLIEKYITTTQNYTYAGVNAFNLYGMLGANWKLQTEGLGPLTWQALGVALILWMTLGLIALALYSAYKQRFSPLLLAAFYSVGIFTLAHRMHERYLMPGVLLLITAAALWNERRLLGTAAAFSVTALLNQAVVYSQVGGEDEFLSSASSQLMLRVVGGAQVAVFIVLFVVVLDLLVWEKKVPLVLSSAPQSSLPPQAQPRWTREEGIALALLTLLTAAVSFSGLGDMTAPQTVLNGRSQPVSGTVQVQGEAQELWVYSCISNDGTLSVSDVTGAQIGTMDLGHTNTFRWKTIPLTPSEAYSISLQSGSVLELAFKDAGGNVLPVSADAVLEPAFDEQTLIPGQISYKNSMYFDEIYHGRTAYEQLHKLPIYETTHPPLGKVFIMLGVALFGMTGFGWRFSGTLFGVLMVPLMYLTARRLTRKPKFAGLAALLLALDGMRFAQSRIATIDVYGTFFILLSAYFMIWYCQSVLEKGVLGSILPMALGGIAFGLGAASKWTGIYAGAGLAVLYFGVLWARMQQKKPGFGREVSAALAGGVAFYVLVPLAIYWFSYFVYRMQDPGFGLAELWQNQMYMFNYHHDLDASHSFASNWYTWPLMLRPVWYYMGSGLPEGTAASIAGTGNPIVWWASTAAVLWLFWRQASGQGTRNGSAVTVLYLTQLLPWMLVPRCTFMYHYFPSLVFAVLALTLCFSAVREEKGPCARRIALVLVAIAAIAFLWLLPAMSGMAVPDAFAKSTEWLPSWGFYAV